MPTLKEITAAALLVPAVQSAAIFVDRHGTSDLELAAAAGIEGPALDGLVSAVRNPEHPIARTMTDAGPSFDVRPINPGGPALRSHLPLGGRGVLAVAHDTALSPDARTAPRGPGDVGASGHRVGGWLSLAGDASRGRLLLVALDDVS